MYAHKKNQKLRKYLREKAKYSHDSGDFKIEESPWWQPAKLIDDLQIFNVNAMQAIVEQHGNRSNLSKNHSRYLDYLEDTKGYLSLAGVPDDAFTQLDELAVNFPNFHEVIDFYREQIALTVYCDGHAFKAQPLLIIGSAGIGKTAFCHRLAKIINTYFSLISFSSMTAGFVLGGMSSSWADGKPGKVVEALAVSHKANPILLLDEIDKAGGDIRHDPLGSLYQLLEPETATKFVDEGLEVPVDCSHIVWVATANELHRIPDPIVSRLAVLEVQQPNARQMRNVLQSIFKNIRRQHSWGHRFSERLADEVVDKIIGSQVDPRLIQRELIRACGRAVLRQEQSNTEHITLQAEDLVIKNSLTGKIRPIGFVH